MFKWGNGTTMSQCVQAKELKSAQTRKSMEDTRVIHADKNIKTKAERDRRVKELKEKNVKLFAMERRNQANK